MYYAYGGGVVVYCWVPFKKVPTSSWMNKKGGDQWIARSNGLASSC